MTALSDCRLIRRWRIVEADLWDHPYLDLVAPAAMVIRADGHGEIAFAYHLGDEAILKAIRQTSSTAC